VSPGQIRSVRCFVGATAFPATLRLEADCVLTVFGVFLVVAFAVLADFFAVAAAAFGRETLTNPLAARPELRAFATTFARFFGLLRRLTPWGLLSARLNREEQACGRLQPKRRRSHRDLWIPESRTHSTPLALAHGPAIAGRVI